MSLMITCIDYAPLLVCMAHGPFQISSKGTFLLTRTSKRIQLVHDNQIHRVGLGNWRAHQLEALRVRIFQKI